MAKEYLKEIKKHANITGIAAGNIATGQVAVGRTYYGLYLRCLTAAGVELTRAQILADISDIIVRLDGEQIIVADATFLLDLQKYYGDSDVAGNVDGIIPIPFTRRTLPSNLERMVLALGTAFNKEGNPVKSLEISVKVIGVAQLATIEVYSLSTEEKRKIGRHIRIKKFAQSFATTGEQEVNSLPLEGSSIGYLALHFTESAGQIDQLNVKVNSVDLYDEVPTNLQKVFLADRKRTKQAGYAYADFGEKDTVNSLLPMQNVQDFRVNLVWNPAAGAPGNYAIYAEQIHGLEAVA